MARASEEGACRRSPVSCRTLALDVGARSGSFDGHPAVGPPSARRLLGLAWVLVPCALATTATSVDGESVRSFHLARSTGKPEVGGNLLAGQGRCALRQRRTACSPAITTIRTAFPLTSATSGLVACKERLKAR